MHPTQTIIISIANFINIGWICTGQMGQSWRSCVARSVTLHNYLKPLTKKVNSNWVETCCNFQSLICNCPYFVYFLQPRKSSWARHHHAMHINLSPPRVRVAGVRTGKFVFRIANPSRVLSFNRAAEQIAAKFPTDSDGDNARQYRIVSLAIQDISDSDICPTSRNIYFWFWNWVSYNLFLIPSFNKSWIKI